MKNAIVLGKCIDKSKNGDGGTIAYQKFSDGLDIVGAGIDSKIRKITLFGEGGIDVKGNINIDDYNRINYGSGFIGTNPSVGNLEITGVYDSKNK